MSRPRILSSLLLAGLSLPPTALAQAPASAATRDLPGAGRTALPGSRPGTERWIVHFKSRPFTLEAYRAEMWGARDPRRVAAIVADLERRVRDHQRAFVERVEALDGRVLFQYMLVNAIAIEIAPRHLPALRELPNVDFLQPDEEVFPVGAAAPIKTATNSRNHNADALQAANITGAGVGVAVIDTGHDVNMGGTGRPHVIYSRRGNLSQSRLCVQRKLGAAPFDDVHGHGTGVDSIVAGWRWNHAAADYGHAYDANIAGYSIANSSSGSSTLAIEAAAYDAVAKDAAQCKIVASNLSYTGSSNPLSIEQKAMDSLALNADVLNATAAGNAGSNVKFSLANINGLSVAAVNENSMTLAGFSSRGMQDGRYFPNVAANGVSTDMARRDNELALWIASGTSMASPQVCGAVTQIRGANPNLKSDETRAVVLAGTFPSPGTASTAKVTGPGAGYLKNDASWAIARRARNSTQHGRAVLDATSKTWVRSVNVRAGRRLQFAIAWHRHDVNSTDWSDLNLTLRRGSTVLVNSDTPKNTEEFVRFTPTRNETLLVVVTLVKLGRGASRQEFGWASSEPVGGGGGTQAAYALYGQGCAGNSPFGRRAPSLSANRPIVGKDFHLIIANARANSQVTIFFGASDKQWLGQSLPLSLTPFGAPGCTLLASGEVQVNRQSTFLGVLSLRTPVPNSPSLLGGNFFNQAIVADPGNNLLNLAVTNAGKATIGSF